MELVRKNNGNWQARWRENGRRKSRTFDRKKDAQDYLAWVRRRQQLGHAGVPDDLPMSEFIETYWRLHAIPNLSEPTRALYARVWDLHIIGRLGDYGVREISPKLLVRFRADLEHARIGTPTIIKAMTIVQSMLSFAIREELVEYNAAAAVKKPRYQRAREPRIFTPREVEQMRAKVTLRDATLISVLAYSGPRPEEVVCRLSWGDVGEHALRFVDTKRHRIRFTPLLAPLARDLKEWYIAAGRPDAQKPVFPAHDGDFWQPDDWRNWRKRVWQDQRDRRTTPPDDLALPRQGCAPAGSRPRDLRSSFVTLRIYEGIPLTQIGREVGTSVRMIELHYAGVIANWNGKHVPAERSITAARAGNGHQMATKSNQRRNRK
jgi:integrase